MKAIVAFAVLLGSLFLNLPVVHAQTSNSAMWLTWRAATYIPAEYDGRALPTPGSNIVVAIDVIQNGKPIDLSAETIYWYVGGSYIAGGTGLTRTAVSVPDIISQNQMTVRVSLPETLGGLARTITIPIAQPQAVITVTPPDPATANRDLSFDVEAKTYFFTVNDPDQLNFNWKVNNQAPSSFNDPMHLHINIPQGTAPGTKLNVRLKVDNITHAFETAVRELILTVQ
jgi:hypothetical protein